MFPVEQTHEMERFTDDQAPPLHGSQILSERTRAEWLGLSERLITAYHQCLTCVQPHLEEAARAKATQATVETTLQGNAAAMALIEAMAERGESDLLLHHKYPWTEIGHAYAAAFTAAGMVALQAEACSSRMASLASELARLALRAAETLAHGVGLLLGTRRSGSIAQVCAYVGTLEGQADTLLRGYLAAPPERRSTGTEPGPDISSAVRQCLLALEAMTDRCEDIADGLLAAAHDYPEERRGTASTNSHARENR
jgi:hypothetical protein